MAPVIGTKLIKKPVMRIFTMEDRSGVIDEPGVELDGELEVRRDSAEEEDVVDADVRQRAVDVGQEAAKWK